MSNLNPFRINTSKNSCTFCISLISGHLKSSTINTSVNFDSKLPIINTSEKTGGGGSSCNWLLPLQSEHPTPPWRASPARSQAEGPPWRSPLFFRTPQAGGEDSSG
jgi:hypothetical protein